MKCIFKLIILFIIFINQSFSQSNKIDLNGVFIEENTEFIFRLGVKDYEDESGKINSKFNNFIKGHESEFPIFCSIIKFYFDSTSSFENPIKVLYYSHNKNKDKISLMIDYSHCLLDHGERIFERIPKIDSCKNENYLYGIIDKIEKNKLFLKFENRYCGYSLDMVFIINILPDNEVELHFEEFKTNYYQFKEFFNFHNGVGFLPKFKLSIIKPYFINFEK